MVLMVFVRPMKTAPPTPPVSVVKVYLGGYSDAQEAAVDMISVGDQH